MTKRILLLIAVIVMAASLPAQTALAERQLVVSDNMHDYNLDPHQSSYAGEAQVLTGLYEGLFSYNPYSLEPVPALASSYKVSRNKRIWTFTIREGATYSDGTPITAEEIRRSWLDELNPATAAPFASLLDCIEGAPEYRTGTGSADDVSIVAADDRLIVTLSTPTEHFNKILCHHAFSAVPETAGVYSGPFVLVSYDGNELIMEKNSNYWDADNVMLPSIKIIQSDDRVENTFQFNLGELDWVTGACVANNVYDTSTIQLSASFGTEFLFFMTDREPWNDPELREALILSAPWEDLRSSSYIPASSLLLGLSGYPSVNGYDEPDIDEALKIMDTLDYTEEELTLNFVIPDNEYQITQAELLQDAWARLGVTVVIKTYSSWYYLSELGTLDGDLYVYTWIGDFADPMAFLELFRGSSSLRETVWTSDEYDRLLAEAAELTDSKRRYEKLADAEQLLLDSFVIMPISHSVSLNFIDLSQIGGWYPNSLDIHPFKYMFILKTETAIPNLI